MRVATSDHNPILNPSAILRILVGEPLVKKRQEDRERVDGSVPRGLFYDIVGIVGGRVARGAMVAPSIGRHGRRARGSSEWPLRCHEERRAPRKLGTRLEADSVNAVLNKP